MSKTARRFPWPLAILPLVEVVFFGTACALVEAHPFLALAALSAAALALCFAVHVFFHECIHYSATKPLLRSFNYVASLALGMPLDGYRVHHYNHHQYSNGAEDFSSTWSFKGAVRSARPLWAYVLGWPRQSLAAGKYLRLEAGTSSWLAATAERIRSQRSALLVAFALLAIASWKFALLYVGLIYLGWAAVALQNYGQHMPRPANEATSWVQPLYNRLLFNNGLHWEHHAHPERPWHALVADARSPRIRTPHLLHPLTRATRKETDDAERRL